MRRLSLGMVCPALGLCEPCFPDAWLARNHHEPPRSSGYRIQQCQDRGKLRLASYQRPVWNGPEEPSDGRRGL